MKRTIASAIVGALALGGFAPVIPPAIARSGGAAIAVESSEHIARLLQEIAGLDPLLAVRYWRAFNLGDVPPSTAVLVLYIAHVMGPDSVAKVMRSEYLPSETPTERVDRVISYLNAVQGHFLPTPEERLRARVEAADIKDLAMFLLNNPPASKYQYTGENE